MNGRVRRAIEVVRVTKRGVSRWIQGCAFAAALAGCGEGAPSAPPLTTAPADAEAPAPSSDALPHGVGVVQAVDAAAGTVTISHQPIESIGWPAMTMPFKVARPELLQRVSVGEKVAFTLDGKDMSASITSLTEAH
jgi:Cu(I)/Ag(I) efflux system periplasmic protein CusF